MTEMSVAEAEVVARFDAAEPAPESWREDGLRESIVRGLGEWAAREGFPGLRWEPYADAVLALPEVAALRAKAAAADRVRELHRAIDPEGYPEYDAEAEAYCAGCGVLWPCPTSRALDGPSPC